MVPFRNGYATCQLFSKLSGETSSRKRGDLVETGRNVESPYADEEPPEMTATSVITQEQRSVPVPTVRPKVLEVLEATALGTGRYISDLLLNLDTAALDLSLAYSPFRFRSDEPFLRDVQRMMARGVHVYEIPMQRKISPIEDARALSNLYRLIKTQHFDIVHGHSSKAGFLARLAAKLADPRIVTIYSPHAISIPLSPKYWYVERFAGMLTSIMLGVSRSERDQLEGYRLVPLSKLRYVTIGINTAAYRGSFGGAELRKRIGIPQETILIGSAGRLTAQKDPATFLKAAAVLLQRGVNAHFAWAGYGELESASQELARRLGIEQQVTFLGYCPDIRPFLDAVDIFALASRFESFGYVTCEAMAMGKPVVATNVAGSNELVLPGVTGYLVDVSDAPGFAVALHELADDLKLRHRMGEAGRARAREHYDLQRMTRAIEHLYKDALHGRLQMPSRNGSATIAAIEANRS
jgi:glycosyltransferase involved in cell wall biosynthesis